MNKTSIAWTDETWNVFSGCKMVSPGCGKCYAKTWAERHRGGKAFPNGFDLTIREHKLEEPLKIKEPRLIFVESMSDFFLEEVPDDLRERMVEIMERTPQHQYQILTKRAHELLRYSKRRKFPNNVWLGVTVESQDYAWRMDILREINCKIRFVSAEPLLSPLDLDLSDFHWVISGGESGLKATNEARQHRSVAQYNPVTKKWEPHPDRYHWITGIRDQCIKSGVAYFHKQ